MKRLFPIFCSVGFSTACLAQVTPPDELQSRALQQARRVAAMENDRDLPSRGYWLGQRAAKNSERLELVNVESDLKTNRKGKSAKITQPN
jgi:hypothetical protein